MFRRLFSTIIAVAACIAVSAQGVCVINGTIDKGYLCDGKKVKSVTLTCTDEYGREIQVATAKVKKDKYTFKYELAKDEPVLMYTIKGFGEGKDVEVFVEPGEVAVNTYNNAGSIATGTPTNDLYLKYCATCNDDSILPFAKDILERKHGAGWFATPEGKDALNRIARESIKIKANLLRMLIDNNASPMTPLMIERWLPLLTPAYADQMVNTIHVDLQKHPYYLSLRNKVLANDMKVGNEVPDITLPLSSGEVKKLSDYRGKYVVLNFWANGCTKSDEMIAEMKNLYNVVKENQDQFIIISVALESDAAAWQGALQSNGMGGEGWLNACDLVGADSPAAKLFGVEKAPKIVLIEQEGRAVSLDMDIDEVVMRVEQILSGDLYYFDQAEYK
jgi:thiol-disulfide isomerase/thioredoxin